MYKNPNPKPYDSFIHPYVFLLKEGDEFHTNFLDYSLLLLQVNLSEVLKSPQDLKLPKPSNPFVQLLKR